MGKRYSHLSDAERWAVESKLSEGLSYAAIGRALKRDRSTIMREARRGRWLEFGRYLAEFGRRYYLRKRGEAGVARCKLDAQMLKPAWTTVLFGLRQDWSPQQLCDRLKDGMIPPAHLPAGVRSLSHETIYRAIYRAIYGMPAGQQHAELVKLLRNSKAGRRKPRKAKGKRFTGLQNMVTIEQRPSAANLRLEPGHWEGDLIKRAFGRSAVGTLVERLNGRPRRVLGRKTPDEANALALLNYQQQQLARETAPC